MTLQDRLSHEGALTPAEQRTATVLLQDSQDVLFLPTTGVAARANVHESTVIRLAQKLGYDGYAALREDLRQEARQVDVLARSRFRDRKGHRLSQLVHDEAQALLRLAGTVDQDRLDALARTLLGARRIFVYGAPILVISAEKRLRRLGLNVVDLPNGGRDVPEKLLSVDGRDVLLAFVLREPYKALAKLTQYAGQRGADIAIISDTPGLNLPVAPQHLLIALRGADTTFGTMTVPIVFCYALELAIYHLAETEASNALTQLGSLQNVMGVTAFDDSPRSNKP